MNGRLHLALGVAMLFCGVACRSTRTERIPSQTASTLTTTRSADLQPPDSAFPKWNPIWWFGNVDDPEPPAWYRPGSPSRRCLWQLRNPLHNFSFYVIGIADKPFTRAGRFPKAVFAPDNGWNWAVASHECVRLPFISFNDEWGRFYFGWRERGNLGFKVNFGRLKPPVVQPPPTTPN